MAQTDEDTMSWNWKQRIDDMMAALEASDATVVRHAEVGAPATDDEIREAEAAIGFALDPRFLAFFRAANGLRVIWVSKYFDSVDDPAAHFHLQREMACAGRINIPSLQELFLKGPGYLFGPDMCGPKESSRACLGGWDEHALRSSLRNLDDFLQVPGDSSYNLLGLVLSERYPDPPVIMTGDYAAALDDCHPMLARDYLAMVIATLGLPYVRLERLKNRGFAGNHDLFVPPAGWLDAVPSAAAVLGTIHDEVSLEENKATHAALQNVAQVEGTPVATTPYASYHEAPARNVTLSDDPLAGMRVSEPDPDWGDYLEGYAGPLTMPLYDETHYDIKEPISDLAGLRALVGQPVKAQGFMDSVGCLVAVDDDGVGTLFSAGDGFMGTSSFALEDAKRVGRAWYLA
ncbi:MAG: SMI1/KNR4 family protein [Myxococcota bacterium]